MSLFQNKPPSSSNSLTSVTRAFSLQDLILLVILLSTSALYFLLLVEDSVPPIGLAVIGVTWLIYWFTSDRQALMTFLNLPIMGLLCIALIGLLISVDFSLSLPKIYGLILGISLFYIIVCGVRKFNRIFISSVVLIALAIGIPLLGVLGADWSGSTYELPVKIAQKMSAIFPLLQRITPGGGIHVNTIGGVLTFFVPFLVSLLWDNKVFGPIFINHNHHKSLYIVILKVIILITIMLVLTTIILTQSRGAILGCCVGVFALATWRDRRFLWLIPILLIGLFIAVKLLAGGDFSQFIAFLDTDPSKATISTRLDYWGRTLSLIQDFPFSGTGIGTYGKVFQELYGSILISTPGKISFYAHNMYLAIIADMGIPAIVFYFALITGLGFMAFHTIKFTEPIIQVFMTGLICGVFAHLIYGFWDNFLLGEKLGAIMWIFFGLITALYTLNNKQDHKNRDREKPLEGSKKQKVELSPLKLKPKIILSAIIYWILISLTAITFINMNIYVCIAIAVIGGILLGYYLYRENQLEFSAVNIPPSNNLTSANQI